MRLHNAFSLLLRNSLKPFGIRIIRLAPNKVRGLELLSDLKYLLRGKKNPVIFDVGANDGETVREFLEAFPEASVVAFEPFLPCCEILQTQFRGQQRISIENVALGAEEGASELNLYSGNRMNSLLQLDDRPENVMKDSFKKEGSTTVSVTTLNSFCRKSGFRHIDILKIDTQGFDLQVLKGASELLKTQSFKVIVLEINFISMYAGQAVFASIHDFLNSFGYGLVGFYNRVITSDRIGWCDACYIAVTPATAPAKAADILG